MSECVVIGTGCTEIGESAFYFNSELVDVELANSVREIRDWAFGYCTGLKRISIHKDICRISFSAFDGCERLERIQVSAQNPFYSEVDGVLYNKDKTGLIRYPCNHPQEKYVVPETVEWIAPEAFNRCGNLKTVILPGRLTQIGAKAFAYCHRLTHITIPAGVRQIGTAAFADCYGLQAFAVENNPYFFLLDECLAQKEETGDVLLQYPLGKPEDTFMVGSSVTKIQQRAFTGANNLKRFEVSPSNPFFLECGGVLFSRVEQTLIQYPLSRTDPVYRVPGWVRIIGDSAFKCSSHLRRIILPEDLTLIRRHAFEYCGSLTEAVLTGSGLRCIEWSAFCGCAQLARMDMGAQAQLEICSLVFQDCVNLRDVTLPKDSGLTLRRGAFRGCPYQPR